MVSLNSKLKIVVLGSRGFPNVQGGVERHCENLYVRLVKKGCDVVVLTRKPYVDASLRKYNGVRLIPLSCQRGKFLEAASHTLKGIFAAKRLNPDILHVHSLGPSLFIPLARLMGLKVVMTYHSKDYLRKKWNFLARMVLKMGEWIGCVFANQIICVSRTVADEIGQKYRHKTVFIPNGVTMPSAPGSRGDLVKLGLEKGKYVLTVGRIDPGKGFSDLIEAFCSSRASLTHKLVIAGRSDHEDKHSFELKQKVKNSPNVILTGFLNSGPLGELYANAALFILPSYHEGLPIVVLEAMSHGLSCVVSDIPANRELQLGEGRYFKPGDIKTLSGKLNVFLKRPFTEEEKASLFKVIAQKYNWENIAEKTMDTYNKVMGES